MKRDFWVEASEEVREGRRTSRAKDWAEARTPDSVGERVKSMGMVGERVGAVMAVGWMDVRREEGRNLNTAIINIFVHTLAEVYT